MGAAPEVAVVHVDLPEGVVDDVVNQPRKGGGIAGRRERLKHADTFHPGVDGATDSRVAEQQRCEQRHVLHMDDRVRLALDDFRMSVRLIDSGFEYAPLSPGRDHGGLHVRQARLPAHRPNLSRVRVQLTEFIGPCARGERSRCKIARNENPPSG